MELYSHRKPRIYGASRLEFARLWIDLRTVCPDIEWTARWPDLVGRVHSDASNAPIFWIRDVCDIIASDMVLCLGPDKPDSRLRGATFECGVAVGQGKPVMLIGESPEFGTWCHHPLVLRRPTLEAAIHYIRGGELEPI